MDIAVVGTGYVGLVTGAGLAEFGNTVVCVDADPARVGTLQRGQIPIFEEGLEEDVDYKAKAGRLSFTTDIGNAVPGRTPSSLRWARRLWRTARLTFAM